MIIEKIVASDGTVIEEKVTEEKSPWMRIADAARYHGVSTWTVSQWIKKGLLQRYYAAGDKDSRLLRLKRSEVENIFQPGE